MIYTIAKGEEPASIQCVICTFERKSKETVNEATSVSNIKFYLEMTEGTCLSALIYPEPIKICSYSFHQCVEERIVFICIYYLFMSNGKEMVSDATSVANIKLYLKK